MVIVCYRNYRNMQGPVFAMFLLLTGTHPVYQLSPQSAPQAEPPEFQA
jgi:hypothetical protein